MYVEVKEQLLGTGSLLPSEAAGSLLLHCCAVYSRLTGPQLPCNSPGPTSHLSVGVLGLKIHLAVLHGFQGLNSSCQACLASTHTHWVISLVFYLFILWGVGWGGEWGGFSCSPGWSWSHYVAIGGLELLIHLSVSPKCWDNRYVLPWLDQSIGVI